MGALLASALLQLKAYSRYKGFPLKLFNLTRKSLMKSFFSAIASVLTALLAGRKAFLRYQAARIR